MNAFLNFYRIKIKNIMKKSTLLVTFLFKYIERNKNLKEKKTCKPMIKNSKSFKAIQKLMQKTVAEMNIDKESRSSPYNLDFHGVYFSTVLIQPVKNF